MSIETSDMSHEGHHHPPHDHHHEIHFFVDGERHETHHHEMTPNHIIREFRAQGPGNALPGPDRRSPPHELSGQG